MSQPFDYLNYPTLYRYINILCVMIYTTIYEDSRSTTQMYSFHGNIGFYFSYDI